MVEQVINRKELLTRLDDDVELLQELIELFLEDYPDLISEIESAIESQDAETLRRSAHTLKGSVGNFCAEAAFKTAAQLEQCGAAADFQTAVAQLPTLVSEMAQVQEALQKLAREYSAS